MKYHLKKIDTSFHQPLPNMVQRLFADVINDAIWFMNIHEQNHRGFIGGVMVIMLASSVVDRGFIGGVMVRMLASSVVDRGFIGSNHYTDAVKFLVFICIIISIMYNIPRLERS
jgi:hypothetical protein